MTLDARQIESIQAIASAIHGAVVARHGLTHGQCKAAAAALAMALAPLGEPVALCHGRVERDGRDDGHVWCRVGHTIIDATADQFGFAAPFITNEAACPAYKEDGFVLFSPHEAQALLSAVRVDAGAG